MKHSRSVSTTPSWPNSPISGYAPDGSVRKAALTLTLRRISALGADQLYMGLSFALASRSARAQTPYKPDAWQQLISLANLSEHYGDISDGLHYGFIVDFPIILHIQSPPNSPFVNVFHNQLHDIIRKEVDKDRYIGPYPLSLIHELLGPFQTSPLLIIPKPGCPGKFRLVQNFSFPSTTNPSNPSPSVNSHINPHNFPAAWGKFSIVYLLASHLPPGSEVAT